MEAPLHQSPVPLPLPPPQEEAVIGAALLRQAEAARAMMAAAAAAQHHQQQQPPAAAAMGREQCPRCASRDTKFCYYNNYNTAQPRHFCRACRRYWTLGGSIRNVPVGGSTRKRPRPARPTRALAAATATTTPASSAPFDTSSSSSPVAPAAALQGGLLGSLLLGSASASTLLALGAAPLLEGRLGFGPGLGQPALLAGANAAAGDLSRLDFGGAGPLLWPAAATVLEGDRAFPLPPPAAALWQKELAAAAPPPVEAGGLHHGGSPHLLL
ncbi:hypothetical protein SETIT_3G371900v2 [Setaria italica]|uniref:Dof zinc finger protein n=1 Tax=Setaria italica TaxID=4555 RepID=A0A368QN25_SETIT|nr:dof zinc finger protein DOF3.1-like [Setaria italica]RCV19282.1 hypothetical protein SETIT_3G371900v2 [Setaria italica]